MSGNIWQIEADTNDSFFAFFSFKRRKIILDTDASGHEIGAIVSEAKRNEKVIVYFRDVVQP